jgi:hypothetical protein
MGRKLLSLRVLPCPWPRVAWRSEAVSFDRDAWLYPFYAALKRDQGFARLAPVLQAKALADAVKADYPAKAVEIRDWNHATAVAMLTWLDPVTRTRPPHRETELSSKLTSLCANWQRSSC